MTDHEFVGIIRAIPEEFIKKDMAMMRDEAKVLLVHPDFKPTWFMLDSFSKFGNASIKIGEMKRTQEEGLSQT